MPKITNSGGPSGAGAPATATTWARQDGVEVPVLPLCYAPGAVDGYVWTVDANSNGSWQANSGGGTALLTQTAVQTGNANALANTLVPVSTASGAVTITLPSAPANGTIVGVKMVIQGSSNAVTVACAGSDVFNVTGGPTSGTLSLLDQGLLLQYGSGIWLVMSDDLPLTQLKTVFLQVANNLDDLQSVQTALNNLAGAVTSGEFLRGNGSNILLAAIEAADLPAGTTSAQGALQLDGSASDIQPAGQSAAAGAKGQPADAKHIHPPGSSFLCTPTQYAPSTQVVISTLSTTMASLNAAATTVAAGSNGGEISAVASWSSPSAGVLDVASTAGWPSAGTFTVATSTTTATCTYTGITATSLTGCAYVSGSATGTVSTGGAVTLTGAGTGAAAVPNISTGSFTAPESGIVLVTAYLVAELVSTSFANAFGLCAHGTITPMVGYTQEGKFTGASLPAPMVLPFLLTLTPSDSYNFDLMFCTASGGTLEVLAMAQGATSPNFSSTDYGAPVIMTVQAV